MKGDKRTRNGLDQPGETSLNAKRSKRLLQRNAISPSTTNAALEADHSAVVFWDRTLLALLLLWTFLGLCVPLADTDFWWHLKTGEWILAGNGIPYVDLYTFTDSDKPWIDLHWGFQILITGLYHLGGVPLVTLAKGVIITSAVAIGWHAGGSGLTAWKKTAIWIPPIICIVGRGNERPEMLSLLFLALWLWIARRSDQRPRLIWWLPLVTLVWVNCHALFILGLVVGVCYAVDAVVRTWWPRQLGWEPRSAEAPPLRTIWIAAGLIGLACFLNPYFEEGALFPWTLYRKFSVEKAFYSQNIGEFQPPIEFVRKFGIMNLYLIAELMTWMVAAFSFVWLLLAKRRWSLFRVLMFAGYSHLAWQASRNTNVFALVAGFVACENFAAASQLWSRLTTETSTQIRQQLRTTIGMAGGICLLCLAVVTGWWNEIGEKNKPFRLGEAPNWFIHDAAKFAGQPGFPDRAFVAHLGQAEVYIYHQGPRRKVFMDARLEVCTQRTFEKFNETLQDMATGNSRWLRWFQDGDLPVVILDSRHSRPAINGLLQTPTWRLVFADRTAAVFLPLIQAESLQLPTADPTPLIYPDGPPKNGKIITPPTDGRN
jgi:hypothetical protein